VSSEEEGRIPLEQTDGIYNPSGGETTVDSEYEGSGYTNAATDIERLLENMAERAIHTQLENERRNELNELAQNISYGNIHEGVDKTVHRINEVSDDMKDLYKSIAMPLLHISKQLQRSIKQQLKDKRSGGKQTGLLMGRRLNSHSLSRNDGRVFYKNALPNDTPEIAIGLLLDESGSMGSCDRATYARASAIILYDFCKALDIPVMVYGHSTSYGVDLFSYAEFEAIDRDDCYRLMDISARGSNRDGAALRFVAEQLSKRHEDIKILILVSDGQPADSGYGGTAAEEDLRGVKQEYTRKGILFIAAAIGNDKENIERIYGDSFLDITDLSKLPVSLTNVVKRHIRV
jgi:nitric oxide reductase activation protein